MKPSFTLAVPMVLAVAAVPARADNLPSCEAVSQAYIDERGMKPGNEPADLMVSDFAAVLDSGTYLDPCAVPPSTGLEICAAVQKGKVAGITVHAHPADAEIERCVADAVVALAFPSHPRMDVVRTRFAPQGEEKHPAPVEETKPPANDEAKAPPRVPPKSGCGCTMGASEAPLPVAFAVGCAVAVAVSRRARRRRRRSITAAV